MIKRVLILGAGTMGQQIGLQCAIHGYDVVYYDISQDILVDAAARVEKLSSWYVSIGRLTQEQRNETLTRIRYTSNPGEAADEADLISESVPEDPEIKGRVFAQFNELCPARTIFTTNTSYLVPSMFAAASGRPERLISLHFHDLRASNVVDVMPHPGTAPEVTQTVSDFAESIGQIVIMLKRENNGYVFNTMLSSLTFSAMTLASKNVASIEDIDRAWMGITHMPIGPFGIMDQVGLKTVWTITDYWAKKMNDPSALANADFVKKYVDKGWLGAKTRQGFYTYPFPSYSKDGFLEGKNKKDENG